MRLVLATRNEHKLREFRALLDPHELVPLPDEVELPEGMKEVSQLPCQRRENRRKNAQ